MKKSILTLAGAMLFACSLPVNQSEALKEFKEAQQHEHDKGVVTYNLEGRLGMTQTLGGVTMLNAKATGLTGELVFNQVPAHVHDLGLGYLKTAALSGTIGATSLEATDRVNSTSFGLLNPEVDIYLQANVFYFDLSRVTMPSDAIIEGRPVDPSYLTKWKMTPFLSGDSLDFTFTESSFDTLAASLFTFDKSGGHSSATLDLTFQKASDLYTAFNLYNWMALNGYDYENYKEDDRIARARNKYREDASLLFSEDFHFKLGFEFNQHGMEAITFLLTGSFTPEALNYELDEDEIPVYTFDADFAIRASDHKGVYKGVSNPGTYHKIG